MKQLCTLLFVFALLSSGAFSQVAINTDGSSADGSAMLDVTSTTKGLLIPRMTQAQRDLITVSNDRKGLLIYQTDNAPGFYFYDGSNWAVMGSESMSINELLDGKTGGNSVFLGSDAGTNDDGSNNKNVGVGNSVFFSNTTGYENTANGYGSLYSNTTGFFNTASGYMSLYKNTTGAKNTANGHQSLYSNTTGDKNTANGYGSLYSNTTGYNNTANGFKSLYSNTTGDRNTANGYQSLFLNTEGNYNTATGNMSLLSNTTGNKNTATGYNSLYSNTTGDNNIGIGYYADHYNQTGNNNTIIGYEAGKGAANHNKSGNVFLGYQAGYSETGSNKLYIQNSDATTPLIYGDFGTSILGFNADVGIGTQSPENNLHVLGSDTLASVLISPNEVVSGDDSELLFGEDKDFTYGMSIKYNGGDNRLYFYGKDNTSTLGPHLTVERDGNVGIGITNPSHPLHVSVNTGSNYSRAIYGFNESTGTGQKMWGIYGQTASTTATNTGAGVFGWASATTGGNAGVHGESVSENGKGVFGWATSPTGINYGVKGQTSSSDGYAGYFIGGKNYFQGDVGIGTTDPNELLEVAHPTNDYGRMIVSDGGGSSRNALLFVSPKASNQTARIEAYNYGTSTGLTLKINTTGDGDCVFGGNVGIGTSLPLSALHVHDESSSNTTIYVTPGTTLVNDSSTVFFAEDHDATNGMYWMYDGVGNHMELWGRSNSTTTHGPHLIVERNNGNVAIGENFANGYRLSVDGKIICEELRVNLQADWPDYVFKENYNLLPVDKLGDFIEENGHLPNIPSSVEMDESGLDVGEMQRLMMEKIEELTLYIVGQQKQIDELKSQTSKMN